MESGKGASRSPFCLVTVSVENIYCWAANIFLIGCLLESGKGASRSPSYLVTVSDLENIVSGSKYICYWMSIGEYQRR